MSGETWTVIGIVVIVVLAAVGAVLLFSDRDQGRRAGSGSRPSRDAFRQGEAPEPPPRKRAAIIVNPTKFEDLDEVKAKLSRVCDENEWDEPLFLETSAEDVGFGQTREALEAGVDLVCALGGDGTVRAVGEELVGTGVPFGLLPGGTGNLLARNLLLPVDDIEKAMVVALTGRNRRIDVAWMTFDLDDADLELDDGTGANSSSGPARHAFFVMAGLGLDAAIMDSTSEELKKRIGWAAYVPSGFAHWLQDRFTATVTVDEGPERTDRARMVVIGNCGKITGGIELLPDAEPDDGLLDIIVLTPRGVAAWASVAARVVTRSERSGKDLVRSKGTKATVTVDEVQRVQLDGDIIGDASRIEVEIEPRAVVVRTEGGKASG